MFSVKFLYESHDRKSIRNRKPGSVSVVVSKFSYYSQISSLFIGFGEFLGVYNFNNSKIQKFTEVSTEIYCASILSRLVKMDHNALRLRFKDIFN